jgi:hypothetical protein
MQRSIRVAAAVTDIWIARVTAALALPAIALARESPLTLVLLAAWFIGMAVGCAAAARIHQPDAPRLAWWTLAAILAAQSVLALTLL